MPIRPIAIIPSIPGSGTAVPPDEVEVVVPPEVVEVVVPPEVVEVVVPPEVVLEPPDEPVHCPAPAECPQLQ
jgi:hypothetical protein